MLCLHRKFPFYFYAFSQFYLSRFFSFPRWFHNSCSFHFKNRWRQTITMFHSTFFASLSFKVLILCVVWCILLWIFYCFKLKREYNFFYCSIEIYNTAVLLSTFAILKLISSVIPVISLQSHILRKYALVWEKT